MSANILLTLGKYRLSGPPRSKLLAYPNFVDMEAIQTVRAILRMSYSLKYQP